MSRDGSLPSGCKDLADLSKMVRVIGSDKMQLGIMTTAEAMKIAERNGEQMILIAPNAKPPIYRLIDPAASDKLRKQS